MQVKVTTLNMWGQNENNIIIFFFKPLLKIVCTCGIYILTYLHIKVRDTTKKLLTISDVNAK